MNRKTNTKENLEADYNIQVVGRNVMVTDSMKDYAIDKVTKIEKFSNRIIDVTVRMDIQKLEHRVDIVLNVDHIKIKGSASSDDMYASIDIAVDRITRQLRRYKKRIQDHQAKGLSVVDMKVNVFRSMREQDVLEVNSEIDDQNQKELVDKYRPHDIVMQETRPLKILTDDESIMKMELSGDSFLVFRGENDQKIKIIYRREDGNFGIIEPE